MTSRPGNESISKERKLAFAGLYFGMLRFVAALLLAVSLTVPASTAAVPPLNGGKRPLSPTIFGPAIGLKGSARVAWSGNVYLAVWVDLRGGRRIYAARVSPEGELLDPVGIDLSGMRAPVHDEVTEPAVVWSGESFFVAWRSISSVFGVRVGEDGRLLDPVPLVLDQRSIAGTPELASNGNSVLLTATRCVGTPSAWTARADGSKIADLDLTVEPLSSACALAAASDGSHYLIVAAERGELFWYLADDSAIVAHHSMKVADEADIPAVAWDGSGYVVAFRTAMGVLTTWKIDAGGNPVGSRISTVGGTFITGIRIWSDGTDTLVGWSDGLLAPSWQIATITADGLEHPKPLANEIDLASDGARYLGVFAPDSTRLERAFFSPDGTKITDALLTAHSAHAQLLPSRATAGSKTATVWQVVEGDRSFIELSVSGPEGSRILPLIASDGSRYSPVIATNGLSFLVAWIEPTVRAYRVVASRLTLDGDLVNSTPLVLVPEVYPERIDPDSGSMLFDPPAIASAGEIYFVAWTQSDSSMRIARITGEGTLLDPEGRVVYTSEREATVSSPSIAVADDVILLAWQDGVQNGPCQFECPVQPGARIMAVLLDGEGNPARSSPLEIAGEESLAPSAAWNGREFLVAWSTIEAESRILAAAVDGLESGDPFEISDGPAPQERPRIFPGANRAASILFDEPGRPGTAAANVPRLFEKSVYAAPPKGRGVRR
ncbi:MAG: hypothetical protein WBX15_11380 [Thermoanaerobaculia bacterium]